MSGFNANPKSLGKNFNFVYILCNISPLQDLTVYLLQSRLIGGL
jgi:hypothetical protein